MARYTGYTKTLPRYHYIWKDMRWRWGRDPYVSVLAQCVIVLANKMRTKMWVKNSQHTPYGLTVRFETFLSFIKLSRCTSASSLVKVPSEAYCQMIASSSGGRAVPRVKRKEIADIKANIVGSLHLRICIGTSEVVKTFMFLGIRRLNPW